MREPRSGYCRLAVSTCYHSARARSAKGSVFLKVHRGRHRRFPESGKNSECRNWDIAATLQGFECVCSGEGMLAPRGIYTTPPITHALFCSNQRRKRSCDLPPVPMFPPLSCIHSLFFCLALCGPFTIENKPQQSVCIFKATGIFKPICISF